jgi:hypothetical protein
MKTKITLIILELPDTFNGVIPSVNILTTSTGKFPFKFISAGSVESTISSLCSDICNVHCDFVAPQLKQLVKEGPSIVEAIYCASVPRGIISGRNGCKVVPLESIFLEDKYGYCIREIPRLTGSR